MPFEHTFENITVERDGPIAVLTLNRPEVRNAIDEAMVREIHDALKEMEGDDTIGCLIFTGAGGKAFAAGADIAQLLERRHRDAFRRVNTGLFRMVEDFPAPTIAAIQGYALGGGCELALSCDLRVAGEGAKLGQPEVGLGIIPGAGATYRLPRAVGHARARELVFTGRIINATLAEQWGLVNRVVPDAKVLDAAKELAADICKQSNLAVRVAKANMVAVARGTPETATEILGQALLFDSPDKMARMTAFLEKRKEKKK
jgi:enoyl-CoA hydratase